jgi:predicted nucleotidyltransferase
VLLNRLADAGIEFVVIGGFAGTLHGSSLITDDVDVCAVLSADSVEKIKSAFADLHPVHRQTHRRLSFLDHPPPGVALNNLNLETDQGVINVLTSVLGVGDLARLKERAIKVSLYGRTFSFISLEDLIVAKEAVGREKDLLSVKELRAIAAMRAKKQSGPDEKR